MSERLYPPELSERFRGFFFALVFALLKRASLLKAKTVQDTQYLNITFNAHFATFAHIHIGIGWDSSIHT